MGGGLRTWIACLAFLLIAAVGCGGDDSASESASQESPTATTEAATSPESEDANGESGGDAGGEEGSDEATGDGDSEGAGDTGSGGAGGGDSAANAGGGDSDGPSADGGGRSGGTGGGSGDVGGPGATPEEGNQPQADSDEKWPPDDLVTVTIKDSKFTPQRVSVPKDGWIMWVNKEEETVHTATKTRGPSYAPNSPPIYWGGDTYTDTFLARGEIEYICTKHPLKMKGFITVK